MKKTLGAKDILFPIPIALVVSGNGDNVNIISIAWIGITSSNPPSIGISLKKNRYSLELIRQTNEFTINIPSTNDMVKTDYCGLVSGKNTNKFNDTNYTALKSHKIKTPIIKECPYNIECKVIKEVEVGDWVLVIGEIVETHVDEDKIENNKISIEKINPLVYVPTIREYWSIGKLLGKSFNVGKKMLNK
jgi:flavin reductase (DIM6/NTAB) family NADH-FMN oxidoreductase RutF